MSGLREIREVVLADVKEVTKWNKEKVIEAYEIVMKLEHIARREGLLALECEAEFMPKEIPLCNHLAEMIAHITDGAEPQFIEELMTLKFFGIYNYTGIEALLYFLYTRSMLLIRDGMPPRRIEELFNAVIPDEVHFFEQERRREEEEKEKRLAKWKSALTEEGKGLLCAMAGQLQSLSGEEWEEVVSCNGFFGFDRILPYLDQETNSLAKAYMNDYRYYVIMNHPVSVTQQELEELKQELEKVIARMRKKEDGKGRLDAIQKYREEEIQLLLRNVDYHTLAVALKGASTETAECFCRNLSSRLRELLLETMEMIGPVRMCEIEAAEEKVVEAARKVAL